MIKNEELPAAIMQGGGAGHIPGIGASVGGHRIGVAVGHGSRGSHCIGGFSGPTGLAGAGHSAKVGGKKCKNCFRYVSLVNLPAAIMQGGGGGHIPGIGASVGGHRIGVAAGHGSRGSHCIGGFSGPAGLAGAGHSSKVGGKKV